MTVLRLLSTATAHRIVVVLIALIGIAANWPETWSSPVWIGLVPPAFYLFAMLTLSHVLACISRREPFDEAMIRALKWSGGALLLGTWADLIFVPSLNHLVANGFTTMAGVHFDFSFVGYVLMFVGLAMFTIARRAESLRAQIAEFV